MIANKDRARTAVLEQEVEQVPNSPNALLHLLAERTNTQVERTRGKLTPARVPLALQSAPNPS